MIIFSKVCRFAMWPTRLLIHSEEEGREEEGDDKDPHHHHPCVYFLKFESKVDPIHAMMTYWGVAPFFLKLNHR
jgi:hypothetical protein